MDDQKLIIQVNVQILQKVVNVYLEPQTTIYK